MRLVILLVYLVLICLYVVVKSCTDFYMRFDEFHLSGRTLDLGSQANWTFSTWPLGQKSNELSDWEVKYGSLGLTANWFGDNNWLATSFYGDGINTAGLSCSCLVLEGTQYEEKSTSQQNVFAGLFCHYAVQSFESVLDLQAALESISIYGPDELAQHFVVRDASGKSLIIEVLEGKKQVYLDLNDGTTGYGITTNEPSFDWHLKTIQHYEWKRSLARQAMAVPGNFYPDDRFLRIHMMKSGIQDAGLANAGDFQSAFALTVQVLNTVSLPMGYQYGTDTGEDSSEGSDPDHSVWGIVRDHNDPSIYWRDAMNPTFRRIRLGDLDLSEGAPHKIMKMEAGPLFIDMSLEMK